MDKDEKLLPEPHDMSLDPGPKVAGLLPATEAELAAKPSPSSNSFLSRHSVIKWQLIVILLLLIVTAVIYVATMRREETPVIASPPTAAPEVTAIPTDIPASSSPQTAGWTNFSYANNENKLSLKYPPGLKVSTNSKASGIDPKEIVPTITFTDANTTITLTLENNITGNLIDWVTLHGTKQATSEATLNNHQVITQYTADKKNLNAYLVFNNDTVLWARSTTNPTDEDNLKMLLSTLSIGK